MNSLDQHTINAVMATFKAEGLVLIPEEAGKFVTKFYEKRKTVLKQTWVTAYEVAEYQLLNKKPSLKTVKNMIEDGRITADETYKNKGVHMVLVSALHRINNN